MRRRIGWALMGIPWLSSNRVPWYYRLGANMQGDGFTLNWTHGAMKRAQRKNLDS